MARQSDTQVTFRLSGDLSRRIDRLARRAGRRRSDVLREAAEAYVELAEGAGHDRPADRVRDLIGSLNSAVPDLAARHSEYLKHTRPGR
jgi:metal-responsive CopG/Arc/MetJ family transcriptional regulator